MQIVGRKKKHQASYLKSFRLTWSIWRGGFRSYHTSHTKPCRAPWAKAKEDLTVERNAMKRQNLSHMSCSLSWIMFYGQMKPKQSSLARRSLSEFIGDDMQAIREKHTLHPVRHGGGSVMLWGCFAASGIGGIECTKGMMKSEDYPGSSKQNVSPRVGKPGLRWWMVWMCSKQTFRSTKELVEKEKDELL